MSNQFEEEDKNEPLTPGEKKDMAARFFDATKTKPASPEGQDELAKWQKEQKIRRGKQPKRSESRLP